jgi:hypothetical protein
MAELIDVLLRRSSLVSCRPPACISSGTAAGGPPRHQLEFRNLLYQIEFLSIFLKFSSPRSKIVG